MADTANVQFRVISLTTRMIKDTPYGRTGKEGLCGGCGTEDGLDSRHDHRGVVPGAPWDSRTMLAS